MRYFALMSLLLLSQSAFGHDVPFYSTKFNKAAGRDAGKAKNLFTYCIAGGMHTKECKDIARVDSEHLEAMAKCGEKLNERPEWMDQFKGAKEKIEQLSNTNRSGQFHTDYRKDPSDGVMHRHNWSKLAQDRAVANYRAKLIRRQAEMNRDLYGKITKTTGTEAAGGASAGVPGAFEVNVSAGGNESTSKEPGAITKDQLDEINFSAEDARLNPWLGDEIPDIECEQGKAYCTTAEGAKVPNNYDKDRKERDEAIKKREEERKKHEEAKKKKKSASVDSEGETKDVDTPISSHEVGKMAGEASPKLDKNGNPEVWATPINDDPAFATKSPIEQCAQIEYQKIIRGEGAKHADPNAASFQEQMDEAIRKLKGGYCDETVLGKDFCQKWNAKRETTTGRPDGQVSKQEEIENALNTFLKGGPCNPSVLGADFCKARKDALDTRRPRHEPVPGPSRPGTPTRPIGSPSTPIRVEPSRGGTVAPRPSHNPSKPASIVPSAEEDDDDDKK